MEWRNIEIWKLIIPAISSLVGALLGASLAWLAFIRQTRRNSVMQVYMDVAQASYEAERMVALWLRNQVDKESLFAVEREEASKAFSSLLGRIGKLHLVASPQTMKAVNEFYSVLWDIYDGVVPTKAFDGAIPPELSSRLYREMKEADINAQIDRFERARIPLIRSMREDLGYSKKDLLIEHNSFTSSFFRDHGKKVEALENSSSLAKS